jgi:RecA-family ATPase
MEWLWDGIVPLGAASVWAGMGGVSKSTFALWFAGRVTRGLAKGEYLGKPSTVLYVAHEDDPLKVTLPRLQVNQVDLSRFATYGIRLKTINGVMMPTFPEDIVRLEQAILKSGAKLVIIDPVLSTMEGDKNMNDARHVREVIDPLNQLAQRLGVAIICIAHVNKGTTQSRTAVSGSGAWVDATRATVIFAMDEVEPGSDYSQVVIQGKKMNYTQTDSAYTYRVQGVDHMHDDGSVGSVPKIQWMGASTRSVDDILNAGEDRRNGWLAKEIKDFIESSKGATTTAQVLAEFKDQNPANVRQTLSRLVKAGKIYSPDRALYQPISMAPQRP